MQIYEDQTLFFPNLSLLFGSLTRNRSIPLAKKLKECGAFGVSSDEYLNYAKQNREEWAKRGQAITEEMHQAVTHQKAGRKGKSHKSISLLTPPPNQDSFSSFANLNASFSQPSTQDPMDRRLSMRRGSNDTAASGSRRNLLAHTRTKSNRSSSLPSECQVPSRRNLLQPNGSKRSLSVHIGGTLNSPPSRRHLLKNSDSNKSLEISSLHSAPPASPPKRVVSGGGRELKYQRPSLKKEFKSNLSVDTFAHE